MSTAQHHEIAVSLLARRRLLEQVDHLLGRLVGATTPPLLAEDLERVNRIRRELGDLYHATACASDSNREGLHEKRSVSHPHADMAQRAS